MHQLNGLHRYGYLVSLRSILVVFTAGWVECLLADQRP